MERWRGRVALVTGASAGIGAGICRELVKQGMVVVGCARNVEKIKAITEEEEVKTASGRLIAIKCDLTKESEILSMFQEIRQKFGHVDVCINNAGMSHDAPLLTGDTNQWREILEVNVLALCICSRESIKLMKEKEIDDGQIIHISSIGGHRLPNFPLAGVHFYSGTKHMVRALTEGLRREVKTLNKHIRVGSISPGLTETEFIPRFFKGNEAKSNALYSSMECLRPKDVANAVVYILSNPPHVVVNDIILQPVEEP